MTVRPKVLGLTLLLLAGMQLYASVQLFLEPTRTITASNKLRNITRDEFRLEERFPADEAELLENRVRESFISASDNGMPLRVTPHAITGLLAGIAGATLMLWPKTRSQQAH